VVESRNEKLRRWKQWKKPKWTPRLISKKSMGWSSSRLACGGEENDVRKRKGWKEVTSWVAEKCQPFQQSVWKLSAIMRVVFASDCVL
jgi:hypothetical protein